MVENISMTIFTYNKLYQSAFSFLLLLRVLLGYNIKKIITHLFLIIGEILRREPGAEK